MAAVSSTLGIDFGTSNSAAGYMVDGKAQLIQVEGEETTLPTALFFAGQEDGFYRYRGALSGRTEEAGRNQCGTKL